MCVEYVQILHDTNWKGDSTQRRTNLDLKNKTYSKLLKFDCSNDAKVALRAAFNELEWTTAKSGARGSNKHLSYHLGLARMFIKGAGTCLCHMFIKVQGNV